MATHTIILYPSSDISTGHTPTSGSNCFNMINDKTDDSGSSAITHTLSSSSSTRTSTFNCKASSDDNPPTGKIKVKSIKIETYWNLYGSNIQTITGSLIHGTAFNDNTNYINSNTSTITSSSNSYTLKTDNISDSTVINQIFQSLDNLNAKLQLSTTGNYTTS